MRLNKYLTEDDSDQIFDTIQKDCKSFIKQLKGAAGLMFRGSHKPNKGIIKIKPRKNRKPVDTDPRIQVLFDKLIKEKYGWKPRSEGVFCTGNIIAASYFGGLNTIWPIGSFKYLWSDEITDLFSVTTRRKDGTDLEIPERYEYWSKNEKELKEVINKYIDSSLAKGVDSKSEIMIGCKSYYMVKHEHSADLRKMFL